MIPTSSGIGAASTMKFVPVLGTITAGFVLPALSAGATYAIGKAFIQHFETGGTLLDFNAPDYREFVRKTERNVGLAVDLQRRFRGGGGLLIVRGRGEPVGERFRFPKTRQQ